MKKMTPSSQPDFDPARGGPAPGIAPEVQHWFSTVDTDRSGHINAGELRGALVNAQGNHFSETACRLMIGLFDADHTGTITLEEFDKLYSFINQWLGVFHTYDRDQSGHIDESELSQAMVQMGFRFSPEFIKLLVNRGDANEKGRVTVDQFIVSCVQIQRFTEAFRSRDTQQQGVISIGFEEFLAVALSCSV